MINYFTFIANEVQEILLKLGVPDLESIIGQTHYLNDITQISPATKNIDLSPILYTDKKSNAPHFCNLVGTCGEKPRQDQVFDLDAQQHTHADTHVRTQARTQQREGRGGTDRAYSRG